MSRNLCEVDARSLERIAKAVESGKVEHPIHYAERLRRIAERLRASSAPSASPLTVEPRHRLGCAAWMSGVEADCDCRGERERESENIGSDIMDMRLRGSVPTTGAPDRKLSTLFDWTAAGPTPEPSEAAIVAAREASSHTAELGMADRQLPRRKVLEILRAAYAADFGRAAALRAGPADDALRDALKRQSKWIDALRKDGRIPAEVLDIVQADIHAALGAARPPAKEDK